MAFGRESPQIVALGIDMHMQVPYRISRVGVERILKIVRLASDKDAAERLKVFLQDRQEALAGLGVCVFRCQDVVLFVERRADAFEKLR